MGRKSGGSVQRVRDALVAAGIDSEVQELAASTRTAAEAAAAVGCEVGQIVKSLVLKGVESTKLYLVLTSGSNRVCLERISAVSGEAVAMADAVSVREQTGFAIGGVPPLGHHHPVKTYVDTDLKAYPVIWAAAGSPNALFHLTPDELLRVTGGELVSVAEA